MATLRHSLAYSLILTTLLLAMTLVIAGCSTEQMPENSSPPELTTSNHDGEPAGLTETTAATVVEAAVGTDESDHLTAPITNLNHPLPYDNAHALSIIRELSVSIGPRFQGTAGERAAADFLIKKFESFGYTVREQRFPIQIFTVDRLLLTANKVPIESAAISRTAGGNARGRLVAVPGTGAHENFAALDVGGAIVLIQRGDILFQEKIDNAEVHGAAGVIIYNNEPGMFLGSLMEGSNIPAISISRAAGLTLLEELTHSDVLTNIYLEGGLSMAESQNIIATSPGDHCSIVVGGHYDTVPGVPGANDNASGTALVLELARAFAGSDGIDQVCFVGFGSEEAPAEILGSAKLVEEIENSGELEGMSAMLNLDVAGNGQALILVGTPSLVRLADAIADTLMIQAEAGDLPPGSGSDHVNFREVGIPVIFPTLTGSIIHVPEDHFGSIKPELLKQVGRIAYATLECLISRAGGPLPANPVCNT